MTITRMRSLPVTALSEHPTSAGRDPEGGGGGQSDTSDIRMLPMLPAVGRESSLDSSAESLASGGRFNRQRVGLQPRARDDRRVSTRRR
jgi:hypothetical protein